MDENPLVSVPTIRERLGIGDNTDTLGHIEAALDDVSALVRDVAGQEWPDAPDGVPGSVVTIVTRVVERVIRNPRGLESESASDYTYRYSSDAPSGVYLTSQEQKIIRRAVRRTGLHTWPTTRDHLAMAPVTA